MADMGGFDLGFDPSLDSSWLNTSAGMPDLTPFSGGAPGAFQFTEFQPGTSAYQNWSPNASDAYWYGAGGYDMNGVGGAPAAMPTPSGTPAGMPPGLPDASYFQQPQTADVLSSRGMYPSIADSQGFMANPQAPFSQDQTLAPAIGQGTGSSGQVAQNAAKDKNDWLKQLMKGGFGLGVAGIGALGSALGNRGNTGGPQAPQQAAPSPLPQAPAPLAAPQAAPMIPLPGTQASPLISGRPQHVQQSLGIQTQDRMRRGGSTGGLQLY